MASPSPEERDPELVVALEMAVRAHSRKHYNAGVQAGISLCIRELIQTLTSAELKKYETMMVKLSQEAVEAYTKSLDGRPR